MIDVVRRILARAHVVVRIEFRELDPVSGPVHDRHIRHADPSRCHNKCASICNAVGYACPPRNPVGRGGQDAQFIDTVHALGSRLPLAVGLVVLTTFVVLFLFTGSVVQPIRALIFGALTLAATLGVLTWMFQDGHLGGVLGFTPRPMDMAMTVSCSASAAAYRWTTRSSSSAGSRNDDHGEPPPVAVAAGLSRNRTHRLDRGRPAAVTVPRRPAPARSASLQTFDIGSGLAIRIDATRRGILATRLHAPDSVVRRPPR